MESKKPFWEYTLPPGVNIGRVNEVVLMRVLSADEETFGFLANMVQLGITRVLTRRSAQLDAIALMTDDEMAEYWLASSRQIARVEFSKRDQGKTVFADLVGTVFECEPTTVQTATAARQVIQALRAMGERRKPIATFGDVWLVRAMKLLEVKDFTADDQAWADKEFNTPPEVTDEYIEAWKAQEAARPRITWQGQEDLHALVNGTVNSLADDLLRQRGRKHLQATTKRATTRASRNLERDARICAEFVQLRNSGSTVEAAWHTLAEKNDLTIERIKQILRAGQPKNL